MTSSLAPARRCAFWMLLGLFALFHHADAARRPGAPRPLHLVRLDGSPVPGSVSNAVLWRARNSKDAPILYFSCEANGTRNLWRAVPDASLQDGANLMTRTWRAAPLTRLNAPYFADDVAPLRDGRGVLCVSNVFEGGRAATQNSGRIARLDLNSGRLNALTPPSQRASEPAVSPDGARFAYVANASTLFVAGFEGGPPVAIENARYPRWLDDETLLVQGTRPGSQGIYRVQIPLALDGTQLVFSRPGSLSLQAAASPDGAQLCVAQTPAPALGAASSPALPQLYLLSSDGSGARAVTGTLGAANPSFAPDGDAILFDAPVQNEGIQTRGLWLLPLGRSVPVALLLGARAIGPDIVITGTAFCEGEAVPRVKLEVGQGSAPTRWTELKVARPPVHQATLARWRPPLNAEGDWLLRLTVSDSDGNGTQSTYPLSLPLEAPNEMPSAPILPGLPLPALPPAPQPQAPPRPQAAPPPRPQAAPRPQPPSRPQTPPRAVTPLPTPTPIVARPSLPAFPAQMPRPAVAPVSARPSGTPPPSLPPRESNFKLRLHLPPRPPKPPRRVVSRPVVRRVANTSGDLARVEVVGTLAVMKPNETLGVSGTLTNIGTRAWTSDGPQPVRLLVRWTDLKSGSSAGWRVVWPQVPMAPGQKLKLPFDVAAPSRAGRYKLTYSLLRLNGSRVVAPPYGSTAWPGEFGAIAFLVIVR